MQGVRVVRGTRVGSTGRFYGKLLLVLESPKALGATTVDIFAVCSGCQSVGHRKVGSLRCLG